MRRKFIVLIALTGAVLVAAPPIRATAPTLPPDTCGDAGLYCPATTHSDLARLLDNYPVPALAPPRSMFANITFTTQRPITRTVTYQVAVNGSVGVDLETFKTQVQEILNDSRGWSRLGVRFERVDSGGTFTVVLAESSKVPGYGSSCDTVWNCNVGNYVIANNARWMGGTEPWNQAGGTIKDYRHMTINHELGHWLGHGHKGCSGAGQAAALMQQQSMDLQGCKFNAWPLDSELTSTRLGI